MDVDNRNAGRRSREAVAPPVNARTYSLAEVAEVYLPTDWTDGVRWLSRRLNAGMIDGYKVGRVWRMTDDDVAAFIDGHRYPSSAPKLADQPAAPTPAPPAVSVLDGLSARSRRRVVRTA